ncbi:HIRAN domain-containing protein [Clostridium sp.]|uniref:HIRAN domain-containing protein n=1 Tax=Clostridium sp. TaxID=1506 RepID=UPI003216C2F9
MDKNKHFLINLDNGGGIIRHIKNGSLGLPFNDEIYLLTVKVSGIKYYLEELSTKIKHKDKIILIREPENKYDKYAISVLNVKNEKIGYVPRDKNKIFSRIMDGGKVLTGEIRFIETYENGIDEIWIKIIMKDF